jgi:hypothetical protein
LFDKLLLEQKQLQGALAALNSISCGGTASALIATEMERIAEILLKGSKLHSLLTKGMHPAAAVCSLQTFCVDHDLPLLPTSFSPFLGAGCVVLQDGVRLSVCSALVLYLLETVDCDPMSTVQIAQYLHMPPDVVVESMAILAELGYVEDGKLLPYRRGSERFCAPRIEQSLCALCDCLSNPKDFIIICNSIFRVLLETPSVFEASLYSMLSQHPPSQVSHTLAQLRAKGVLCLNNGFISFTAGKVLCSEDPDYPVPKVDLIIDAMFLLFKGTRFEGSRWLLFDRARGTSVIHAPGLDIAASSVSGASSCCQAFSSSDIQSYLTTVVQTIESCATLPGVAFAEILSDFVKCGGCPAKTLLLHFQKHSSTPTAIPDEPGEAVCSICLEEPCALWFPCCANHLCEQCFKIHYFAQNATSRSESTPTVSSLIEAASFPRDAPSDLAAPITFRCPFASCEGVLPRKRYRALLSNLQLFSNEMATALSKAAVSLCNSMRPSSAYALCTAPLSDGGACSKFHVGVTAAACFQCDCGVHSSVSVMKLTHQDLKDFPYLNLTPSQVVDWFNDDMKSKLKASPSERIELDDASLASGTKPKIGKFVLLQVL